MAFDTHVADKISQKLHIYVCGAPLVHQWQAEDNKPTCKKCKEKIKSLDIDDLFGGLFGGNPYGKQN